MDTLTQFVLGASIGVAVLGRRPGRSWGPRRAAIAGGLLGSLPDLDVLMPSRDAVDAFVSHRGFSHSLLVHAMVTPIIGEAMTRFIAALRQQRPATYAAVFLCLTTHALLDGLTVYGTKLLWPLVMEPYGVGSVFIIDVLYTLPLLVAAIWALCLRQWSRRMGVVVGLALALSSAYQAWCFGAQQIAMARAEAVLRRPGITADRMLAIPTPFNSYFWRVIALHGDRYLNIYLPLFGGPERISIYDYPRNLDLEACLDGNGAFERLAWFSRGYYRLDQRGDEITVSDLRMGLTPDYVFQYAVAQQIGDRVQAMAPRRIFSPRGGWDDIEWLLANMTHTRSVRAREGAALVGMAALTGARHKTTDHKTMELGNSSTCKLR
ncbi:MAG: metal-dependent hydrolase [Alphaproteobacteria bacterium]|jgi:inner membrane protein